MAAGADGLIIEVHNNPEKALCDSCSRRETKTGTNRISRIYRPWEIEADPEKYNRQGIASA